MDVLLHLEPNPTPFHCRWDRFHFECCLLPLKPNLSFSAAVLEDQNRAFTLAILLVRASFIHQNKIALRLGGGPERTRIFCCRKRVFSKRSMGSIHMARQDGNKCFHELRKSFYELC